jgi:hypothetical protein
MNSQKVTNRGTGFIIFEDTELEGEISDNFIIDRSKYATNPNRVYC